MHITLLLVGWYTPLPQPSGNIAKIGYQPIQLLLEAECRLTLPCIQRSKRFLYSLAPHRPERLETRKVRILGITRQPCEVWMKPI